MKKKQTKSLFNVSILSFLVIFFGFFIFEYGLPIYNVVVIAFNYMDTVTFRELLEKHTVFKHFLRFPLYAAMYATLFYFFFKKKSILTYRLLRLILFMHLLITPLGKGFLLSILYQQGGTSLFFPVMFILATVAVYAFSILYIDDYKKLYIDKKYRINN